MLKHMLKVFTVLLAAVVFLQPVLAQADGRGRDRNGQHDRSHRGRHHHDSYRFPKVHRHYPAYGKAKITIPIGNATIVLSGSTYHYHGGVFYRRMKRDYVVVPPPVGVVIAELPWGCQKTFINGATYYTVNGVYYQYTPHGYVVVAHPGVSTVAQSAVIMPPVASAIDVVQQQAFTVNVPNIKGGGYTAVTLTKSGEGFIGPQGEYYAAFPSIDQLQLMYTNIN